MFLEQIYQRRKAVIEEIKKREALADLKEKITYQPYPHYSLKEALTQVVGLGIIGEVKRASPSKGVLSEKLDAVAVAKDYERHGVVGISVLTEPDYFKGSYSDLENVRQEVCKPLLNKDFIFDQWQVYKAKSIGADAILLIATMLPEGILEELYHLAQSLALDVLLEIHDEEDMKKIEGCEAAIVGINNRNLYTFETTLQTTTKLVQKLPRGKVVISESGVHTAGDTALLRNTGIHGVLVGESLVKSKNIGEQLEHLRSGWYVQS